MGRQFPVTVEESETVAVQQSADIVNERLRALRKTYVRQDDLDIALMCCLQLASDLVAVQQEAAGRNSDTKKSVAELNTRLAGLVNALKP